MDQSLGCWWIAELVKSDQLISGSKDTRPPHDRHVPLTMTQRSLPSTVAPLIPIDKVDYTPAINTPIVTNHQVPCQRIIPRSFMQMFLSCCVSLTLVGRGRTYSGTSSVNCGLMSIATFRISHLLLCLLTSIYISPIHGRYLQLIPW